MADHIWTVLCTRHLVDPDSKVISLMDVSETLASEGLEQRIEEALRLGKKGALVKTPLQLVSWWWRSPPDEESLQVRFLLLAPGGEQVVEQIVSLPWGEAPPATPVRRLFLNFDNLPATKLGLHWFVVEQNTSTSESPAWAPATKIPLLVETV